MLVIRFLRNLFANTQASVATLGALSLPVVLGALGLAVDLNRGYEQRLFNQRSADMAALGAAMAFKASSNVALLSPTANDITRANGLTDVSVQASVVENYPASGSRAVRVVITKPIRYTLARVLGFEGTYNVRAEAYATLTTQAPYAAPCFLALASGANAITITGGASINAPSCSVAAVGNIAQNGSSITGADIISGSGNISVEYGSLVANSLRFAGSFSVPAWNGAVPPANKRVNQATTLVDPWANDTALVAARAQLGQYTTVPTLAACPVQNSTQNWTFAWSTAPTGATGGGGTWTVPKGTYYINNLSIDGGVTVSFQSGSKIYIKGNFNNNGTHIKFGDSDIYVTGTFTNPYAGLTIGKGEWCIGGAVNINGKTNEKGDGKVIFRSVLTLGGGTTLKMGAGDHHFGGVSVSGGSSMALGNGNFTSAAGIVIAGGGEVSIGTGNVILGPASDGNAIKIGGSSAVFMEDGTFSANGHIDTEGNSRVVFGKTANHYINGNMNIRGGVLFGAGRYTINGNFVNGTGGAQWPWTSSFTGKVYGQTLEGVSASGYDMVGVNVSFILKGTLNLAGGAKTKLIAPTASVTGGQIAELLLDTTSTAATNWGAGAQNVFVGTVHVPNSTVTMSGGNTTLSSGQCFTLIASKIAVTGGAATGSACPKMSGENSGSGSGEIKLIK